VNKLVQKILEHEDANSYSVASVLNCIMVGKIGFSAEVEEKLRVAVLRNISDLPF